MASDETQELTPESNYSSAPLVVPKWGRQNGAGRTKGTPNKTTTAQRAFASRVLGEPGTPEFDAFVDSTRKQLLAGILPPAITALILHSAYGKPKETVEVEGSVTVEKIVREVIRVPDEQSTHTEDAVH